MPSGVTHLRASLILDIGLGYLAYEAYKIGQPEIAVSIAFGAVSGTLITPDYDLENLTETERIIRKFPVIGDIWVSCWYPYALMNPHRGRSHSIAGTIERQLYLILLYLSGIVFLVGLITLSFGKSPYPSNWYTEPVLPDLLPLLVKCIAWLLHDLLHYKMDGID